MMPAHRRRMKCAQVCSSLSRRSSSMSVDGGADFSFAVLHQDATGILIPNEPAFVALTMAVRHLTHTKTKWPPLGTI